MHLPSAGRGARKADGEEVALKTIVAEAKTDIRASASDQCNANVRCGHHETSHGGAANECGRRGVGRSRGKEHCPRLSGKSGVGHPLCLSVELGSYRKEHDDKCKCEYVGVMFHGFW
jgi:hypothetical protein